MAVKTQWFKDRLADRQLSQRGLARAMGLDSAAVSLMFRGRREMKISEAVTIANLLGRPAEEVMEAAGVSLASQHRTIPLCSFVDGMGEIHQIHGDSPRVPHPGGDLPAEITASQARTAGTPLDYMDGWIMLCSRTKNGVPAEAIGRLSICKLKDGIAYLAKPTRSYVRGRWNLNGPAATANDVELLWAKPILHIVP